MMKYLFQIVLILALVVPVGCAQKVEQGKVVGIKATMNFSDLANGDIRSMYYEGMLIIEKANGERVDVFCEKSLVENIKSGQKVEITFDKALNDWKVVKLIE